MRESAAGLCFALCPFFPFPRDRDYINPWANPINGNNMGGSFGGGNSLALSNLGSLNLGGAGGNLGNGSLGSFGGGNNGAMDNKTSTQVTIPKDVSEAGWEMGLVLGQVLMSLLSPVYIRSLLVPLSAREVAEYVAFGMSRTLSSRSTKPCPGRTIGSSRLPAHRRKFRRRNICYSKGK